MTRAPSAQANLLGALVALTIFLVATLALAALELPGAHRPRRRPRAYSAQQAKKLARETKSRELEDKSGIQLVVATIPSLQEMT